MRKCVSGIYCSSFNFDYALCRALFDWVDTVRPRIQSRVAKIIAEPTVPYISQL